MSGADVNDEIRSLVKASSGFTGQLVRKAAVDQTSRDGSRYV